MKPLSLLLPILAATIPLSTSAPSSRQRQQPLSPASSFSTTDSSSSSTTSSQKSSLRSKLSSFLPTESTAFKCHHYPRTPLLPNLIAHITDLLRSNRESIFSSSSSGKSDQSQMLFESCYAGYAADDVKPSIYFKNLAQKQSKDIEKLLRNSLVGKFPGVEVVRMGNAIAVVMREGVRLKRRNTV